MMKRLKKSLYHYCKYRNSKIIHIIMCHGVMADSG